MGFFNKFFKSNKADSKEENRPENHDNVDNTAKIDLQQIQDIANKMYPGIQIFVRDVNLNDKLADKYLAGMIIRERAFTDASKRVMGMITTHRYMILSNHMADLSLFEHGTNWGLCVANKDSHFKVLGQHTYKGKKAIVLLHLPDDITWKLFEKIDISFDQQLLKMAIQRFEVKCELPPVAELVTLEWLDRCSFPIGMNDKGELWELE